VLLPVIDPVSARFVPEVSPLPLRPAPIGVEVALLAMASSPVCDPPAVGENFTDTVQEPPAAIELPQLLVCENAPLVVTEEMVSGLCDGLATVTVCAALVEPTFTYP
jgi:hypothetical protein